MFFILGVLFCQVLQPLFNAFVTIIEMELKVYTYKRSLVIAEYNQRISEVGEPSEGSPAIGFEIPTIIEEEDDE